MPKILVMYPMPNDMDAFERAYNGEHIPLVAPIFGAAGATKGVFTKVSGSPAGQPAFHRIAEIHVPSMESLQACAASPPGREAIAHAHKISNGGPPTVLIGDEQSVTF